MLENEFEEKFNIKLKKNSKKNIVSITLEIDENDGDYNEKTSELDIPTFEKLLPVLKAIKSRKFNSIGDNKRDDYIVPEDLEDDWNDIEPSVEYGGHDLCILDLVFYNENGEAFDIKLK
jgi:hypothetical protein